MAATKVTCKDGEKEVALHVAADTLVVQLPQALMGLDEWKQYFDGPPPDGLQIEMGATFLAAEDFAAMMGADTTMANAGEVSVVFLRSVAAAPAANVSIPVVHVDDSTAGTIMVTLSDAAAKDVLASLELLFEDGDLSQSVVQFPSKAAGVFLSLAGSLTTECERPLLARLKDAISQLPVIAQPPVPATLGVVKIKLPPGVTAAVAVLGNDGECGVAAEMKDEETRLPRLIAKQPPLIKTIMEQGLGPPGACAFAFTMATHTKKQHGANRGHVITVTVPNFTCILCCTTDPECIEDHSSTKRHLLLAKHLDAAITGGQLTGYATAKEVLAAINDAPDIDCKKKLLTSTGRRANSSQGKAVERGRQAAAMRQHATAFMTAAAMGQLGAQPGKSKI